MSKHYFRKISLPLLLTCLLLVLFGTNPNELPLPLLVLPFTLIFGSIFLSTLFIFQKRSNSLRLFSKKSATIALAVAGFPVLLLVFLSIHQLSIRDVMITLGLLGGILFYLSKTDVLNS